MADKPTHEELEQKVKEPEKKALGRRKLERDLRIYKTAVESSINAIGITDLEGKLIYANDSCVKMWGYNSKVEILGRFLPEFWEGDGVFKTIKELREKGLAYGEDVGKRKDGSLFFVQFMANMFKDEAGNPSFMFGSFFDITERKQIEEALSESENRYRAVVESQTEMICRFFPDGTLTFVNEAYCRYFDKGREELIGHKFMPIIPESNRDKVFENIASLNPNTPVITHEHRVFAPNGKICWHKWTNRAIFDDKSNLVEYQAVGWDITNRIRVEESLQKAHDELERRVEERTRELEVQKNSLEEMNIAMKVLLEKSEVHKKDLEEKILYNIKELVDPYLEKLEGSGSDVKKIYLSIIKSNIDEIISPFTQKLSNKYLKLTSSEIRIASLVKQGKTSKEIAGILNISGKTVGFHRESIRKKLGLKNKKANLRSHLLSLQ